MVAADPQNHGSADAASREEPEARGTVASAGGGMEALLVVGGLYIDEIHLLPHFPPEDSALRSLSFTRRRGGNAATNACVLAQLVRERVMWVGAVPANGADGAAQFGLDAMQRYGVDVSLHERVPDTEGKPALGMPTSVILASQAAGTRTIVSSRRGLRETSPAWVRTRVLPSLPPRCWVHFEAREYQSVHEIMKATHTAQQLQPGWRLSIEIEKPAFTVAQLLAFAALADVCFISREWAEANVQALLDGRRLEAHDAGVPNDSHLAFQTLRALEKRFEAADRPDSAAQGSGTHSQRVVWFITWGELGAFALECTRSGRGLEHGLTRAHFAPAQKVERVVDSTGAGDTFNAAVLSALSGCSVPGADAAEALTVGCLVAGKKVAQDGFDGLAVALETIAAPAIDSGPRGLKRKAE